MWKIRLSKHSKVFMFGEININIIQIINMRITHHIGPKNTSQ